MDNDHPSLFDVLIELGGRGFVLGTVMMAAFPFALPLLILCAVILPLLLPLLVPLLVYGLFVAVRRLVAAVSRRRGASTQRGRRGRRPGPQPTEAYPPLSGPAPPGRPAG